MRAALSRISPLSILAVLLAGLVLAPAAHAGAEVDGGSTTLRLAPGTASALGSAGVSVTPIEPASGGARGIAFPITGGDIHPTYGAGTLTHSGGLTFRAGSTSVRLTDFQIRQDRRKGTLTALVGDTRVPILKIDRRRARVTRNGFATNVSRVRVTLTGVAARALNGAFDTRLLRGGLLIGTLTERIVPAEAVFRGDATTLALDPGAASALTSLGIEAAPVGPATAGQGGLSFPITSGNANLETLAGTIRHSGGISLTRGSTRVELTRFYINVDDAPDLTAVVGGQRLSILNLDVSGLTRDVEGRQVTLGNVKASLTAGAASALNQAFGTNAFREGLVLGTATVVAEGR